MEDIDFIFWANSVARHPKRQTSTIPKVPERIRRGEKDAYEPRIISFGPNHHGEPRLHAMEKNKWSYRDAFFSVRPRTRQSCINAIKEEEAKIRACYTDNFDIGSEQFVEMILNDGCFLVGYFLQFYYNFFIELESVVVGMHDLIRYDILLLENQLPFFILIKIFDLLEFNKPSPFPSSFMDLAINYLNCWVDDKKDNFQPLESVHHLLHLYHSHCLYSPAGEVSHVQIRGKQSGPKPQPPSVTVLHEAGVKFEKKEEKGSSSLDVTFDITNGKMMIPPLVIDTFNMSRLRNLVAFEQFYPNFHKLDKSFTAYVEFMDFIVNTPADVALLHKKGIIRHFLGSDKNAAVFLNDLNRGVYVQPDHYLAPLYEQVYNFMQKRRHRWHATLIHNYCNSPWAVLGIVVGGILLVFTLLQTIFSGLSAF